ncbi:MAG TPA: cation-transporting P-type ATPase, partial [Candidatus Saccharimonadales bacterium]
MGQTDYYLKSLTEVTDELNVNTDKGLDAKEAGRRLNQYGPNELVIGKKINPLKLFLNQFNDVLIMVLLAAAGVSFGLSFIEEHGSATESLLIIAIVIAIAVVGFFNEYKAEKTVEALRKLVGHNAKVRRDGQIMEIPAGQLVQGDIVLLEEGMKVPGDIRLSIVKSLK